MMILGAPSLDNRLEILFPLLIQPPLRRNPIPTESRNVETDPIRGYPMRWSRVGLEWYPYLPAACSFHYPIFRGMNTSPRIIHGDGGYTLEDSVISRWSNIEHVMSMVIESLRGRRMTSTAHRPPEYPHHYGYGRMYRSRRGVKDAVGKSLCAFQQMLAYCSYSAAGVELPVSGQYKPFYEDPSLAEDILDGPPSDSGGDISYILRKLVWSTLGEVRQTRNFVGAAITHCEPFEYEFLSEMANYGVPVYVSWCNHLRLGSYSSRPSSNLLLQWCPPREAFGSLGQSPACLGEPIPSAGHVPAVTDKRSETYPWDYVLERQGRIASKLTKSDPSNQTLLSRAKSAKSFAPPDKQGARVYEFERVDEFDESTGEVVAMWKRSALTGAQAAFIWDSVKRCNLW